MAMQTQIISLTLAYIAGLLLGQGFLYFPWHISILGVFLILAAGFLVRLDKLTLRQSLIVIIPCVIGMASFIYSAAWFPADHFTRLFPLDKTRHSITGRIASPLDRDPDRTGFILELDHIDDTPVRGAVRVSLREASTSLGFGDRIRTNARLRAPGSFKNPGGFDYAEYLARRGVFGTMSVRSSADITLIQQGTGLFRAIQNQRERIRQAFLANTSGPGSAILQAMVLGEEGGLTDDVRDRFQAAGVTHIISISGSHLGMVALLCFGLIRGLLFLLPEKSYHLLTLRADPKKIAAWLTLPLVVFYTLLAGGQVATIRSLIMIAAGLAAIILDREHALMHSLALAALGILLASPQALFDISFQLSYLSVLVIGYVVSAWNDTGIRASTRTQKVLQSALLLISISLATGLVTGPLAAFYFNQFSLAGILSNLFVVPFAGAVVVPLGLFSGVLSLFTQELPLAWLNQFASDAFIRFVAFFARLPLAEFRPPAPGLLWLFCYALFFLASLHVLRAIVLFRFKPFETPSRVSLLPKLTLLFTGTALLLGAAFTALPKHRTALIFPDVGQGDCALVELASGSTILIDGGGTPDNRFDLGRRVVAPFLWNRGVRRLDLVVLSHPHPDHMNGLLFLLEKFNVREVWVHGLDTGLPGYETFRQLIAKKQIPLRVVTAEDAPVLLGGAEVSVLHPAPGFVTRERKAYAAENSRSLVLRISEQGKTFLFSGDIGADAEANLIRSGRNLKCDVLKVPHHGSRSSSSEAFVANARPGFAVVTVGRENLYRHPADEVISRYDAVGARILRTDQDGAVTIFPNRGKLETNCWSWLELRRIALADPGEWKIIELQNLKRLWQRMTSAG